MKVTRILNRGRVVVSSPQPVIDSGRTSWSSASRVSTIDTKSPEPRVTEEEVTQKLQESIPASSVKKKVIVGVCIAAAVLLLIGLILGIVLPLTSNKPPTTTTSTITSTDTTVIKTTLK